MSTRWGDVYSPVRQPAAWKIAASIAQTEPLPLVPATWTIRNERSGLPIAESSASIRSRPGVMPAISPPRRPRSRATASRYVMACPWVAQAAKKARRRRRVSRSSRRSTTRSSWPCSSRNSERWKPSGSGWRIVSAMTRGPAKPMSARGSAMMTSPSMAKLAVTPPVVGSVSRDRYGSRSRARRCSAAEVLAICMSDRMPSCMRAPPEADTISSGTRLAIASSIARVSFSPTTEPMLPPMNANSNTATDDRVPADAARGR